MLFFKVVIYNFYFSAFVVTLSLCSVLCVCGLEGKEIVQDDMLQCEQGALYRFHRQCSAQDMET